MDCSVIVLAWQESVMTRRCVASIGAGPEVIVVDNGSDEPHAGNLKAICQEFGAIYVRAPRNLGFAGGMNLGLLAATRSVVIFSNNDIEIGEGTLESMVHVAQTPGVGAVFPAVRNLSGTVVTAGGRFLTAWRAVAHLLFITAIPWTRTSLQSPLEEAEWFTGPFVGCARNIAVALGGMPSQAFFYGEDYRICWELRSRGYRLVLQSDVYVTHADDATAATVYKAPAMARMQTATLVQAALDFERTRLGAAVLFAAFRAATRIRALIRNSDTSVAVAEGVKDGWRAHRLRVEVR